MDTQSLATFEAQGYCILRNFIPAAQLDAWQSQIWGDMVLEPDRPEEWGGGAGIRNIAAFTPAATARVVYPFTDPAAPSDPRPLEPAVGDQPRIRAVLDQLLSKGSYAPGVAAAPEQGALLEPEVVAFNWPSPDPKSRPAHAICDTPHIEGYRGASKGGPTPQWMVGCTFYLDDVGPAGGATCIYPRSHLAVHRYFCEHPGDIPTGCAAHACFATPTLFASCRSSALSFLSCFD